MIRGDVISPGTDTTRRRSLLKLSLFLGTFGFGGGMALIAMARHRLVDRDHWLDDETFLRDLAVAQSVPGTTVSNLITLLGLRAGGWRSALGCLTVLLLPSTLLMALLGAGYGAARDLRIVQVLFAGLGPAVVAITASVGLQLLRRLQHRWQLGVAAVAAALVIPGWLSVFQVVIVTATGALLVAHGSRRSPALLSVSLPALAWVFTQISLSMFGGGLAMVTAVEHQLVNQRHWLTAAQFSDGIALSQITPGPVATASTFFGYLIAGPAGALVATLAIFVPAIVLVFAAARFLHRVGDRPDVKLTLQALSAATLGIILAASVSLARSGGIAPHLPHAVIDGALVLGSLALLWRGLGPLWILGGSVVIHAALEGLVGAPHGGG